MDLPGLIGLLAARRELRKHDLWSRDELLARQGAAIRDLRRFALARSPLYAQLHRGLEDAPFTQLPVMTKATVMERFDDLVTDRDIHLKDVEHYLQNATATSRFRERYRVAATGGTTGRRGIFLSDPTEWRTVLASYSRAYDWAGIAAGLTRRVRMAVVSSRKPTHQSSIVGATVASPFIPTLRLDAAQPIDEIVHQLNAFWPDALVGYASILRTLAEERIGGRLSISPQAVMSASEVLTDETRERLRSAFGVSPTNVYAATETAGIASECRYGRMHRYEDLVVAEVVDEANQPVKDGRFGAKLLVTVLFSRTQPLIRYEISDRVASADGACEDGLPFSMFAGIEGREEETLRIGEVTVHPNVFHGALEPLPLSGWQVIERDGRLRVLVVPTAEGPELMAVDDRLRRALDVNGVRDVSIAVEAVETIPRTSLGKAPLIRRDATMAQPAT